MTRLVVALVSLGIAAVLVESHGAGEKEWTGKAWLGKWISTDRSENWDAFVQALGAHYDGNHLTVHKLYKQGDHFHHHISVKDSGYKRDIDFQLGQENQIQHNGTTVTYKYTEDGDVLKSEIKGITNKAIHDTYTVKGDELEKTYQVGDVLAKRWYKKKAPEAGDEAAAADASV